ncbi:MAG: NAD(P)/FAD-dependent oxidoreductase [Chloroflexota bacterium]
MQVAIIGGGMTGLSAAYELAKRGIQSTVYERDEVLGGLAGSFKVNGVYLEKFYHHLFTSDAEMVRLLEELGLSDTLQWNSTATSLYAMNRIFRLATPTDVLRFKPLGFPNRIRLGLLAIVPRLVRDWRKLEDITAKEWLVGLAGEDVFRVVWEPLLRSKFGSYADQVAAVWFWNKLKLRGGSRGKEGAEKLGYLRGGFGQVIEAWERRLLEMGVELLTSTPAQEIRVDGGKAVGVIARGSLRPFDAVLVTTAPAILAQITPGLPESYRRQLSKLLYLANVCLVMKLRRSLSSTYWLNIADPAIPFVAVIEHTNMQRPEEYGGRHLAYLSRYTDPQDRYYSLSAEELFAEYLPYLKRMFPEFDPAWVEEKWAWRELYTQPVIVKHYSELRPDFRTPIERLWLSCMAQVYPQDRGMNYAVLWGKKAVEAMLLIHRGERGERRE